MSKAKRGLASDPLAALTATRAQGKPKGGRRQELTSFSVSVHVGERVRNAAHYNRETLMQFVETALMDRVEALEEQHGGVFPPRPEKHGP
jgi:hypothetical protein